MSAMGGTNDINKYDICLKMPSKLIRILRITFCYKQLCGRCLVHTTQVVKVVIHCVFAYRLGYPTKMKFLKLQGLAP